MEISPLELAARAIVNRNWPSLCEADVSEMWPDHIEDARAVLMAIREPSGGMILAANLEDIQAMHSPEAEITCWQAMIDAALA